jgi:hypothetical protein
MKTIRRGVFETNSSTTHCASFSKDYSSISQIPLRDKKTFPTFNENGELEVEMNIYWDMEVCNGDIDLDSVDTIIKYLAAHAVFSSEETKYGRKNHEVKCNFDKNHTDFLNDLIAAYKKIGLTPPKDVKYYFLDVNDNKIYITKDNLHHWIYAEGVDPWYDSHSDWAKYEKNMKKKYPNETLPYAKNYFGMCGNDLLSNSYAQATDYYENSVNVYNWDENTEESEETGITTIDMLTREISLNFYHT